MDAKDTLKNPREMSRLLFGLQALERDLKASLRHAWELHEHGHFIARFAGLCGRSISNDRSGAQASAI